MITAGDELVIREYLASKIAVGTGYARVIPSPLYFAGPSDYFASHDGNVVDTLAEVDGTRIEFCEVYPRGFEDGDGPPDSPVIDLVYEIYMFTQADYERADENVTPDAFNKKMLKKHNDFIAAILGLKAEFQGDRNMGVLDTAEYIEQLTTSVKITSQINNAARCRFVMAVRGYEIIFEERVRLQLRDC